MNENIFIGVAWPYANGPLHLGHMAGAYLPADIFARYHRAKGNRVLMVSGSDQHGTPITIQGDKEGKSPREIAERYHGEFCRSWADFGISFDLFTSTNTENHIRVAQEIFRGLLEKGHIYKGSVLQPHCPQCRRSLPDRYVEGTCPSCQSEDARGDQCNACGKPMNAAELLDPHCNVCGTSPEFNESEHFFLKLSGLAGQISPWVARQKHWRPNVMNLTLRYLKEGLKDRAITRDISWGVPLPLDGYEGKCLYVWFEAVIGYYSASREWAEKQGEPDAWKAFWQDDKAKSYYFIGKDNIPFHTLIWPAMIMGYDGLNLPYDVPSNEFLTIEGRKLSTSWNWAVWLHDYLERYDPDPLRYLLSVNMPDAGDTDFSWREFVRRNNDELVAAWGNLVNRVLTFTYKNFNGAVPEHTQADEVLLAKAADTGKNVDELISLCKFKDAIKAAMALAHEANRYLEEQSPWKTIKEDRQAAANALFTAIRVIAMLKDMLYPFLPFSSQAVHEYLGFSSNIEDHLRERPNSFPLPGQPLVKPAPLFKKLEESVVAEETARLGQERS
ncbi:methionine--tRNA ligase [Chloroflexota bacterium]